jgi:hypothetical protein
MRTEDLSFLGQSRDSLAHHFLSGLFFVDNVGKPQQNENMNFFGVFSEDTCVNVSLTIFNLTSWNQITHPFFSQFKFQIGVFCLGSAFTSYVMGTPTFPLL